METTSLNKQSNECQQELANPIDLRLRNLSYSSLNLLHSCPRKYELTKLQSIDSYQEDIDTQITFAFGHAVGDGIALILAGYDLDEVIWRVFLNWPLDTTWQHSKSRKSLSLAIVALQKFNSLKYEILDIENWEVLIFNGKPAIELSLKLNFPGNFYYRGYIDIVLQHKLTKKVLVVECKTTAAKSLSEAQYQNSNQATGYAVILDHIFPRLTDYEVLYLVYQSEYMEYHPFRFNKGMQRKAQWIAEVLLDIEMIKKYNEYGIYPTHGDHCVGYNKVCRFFDLCHMSNTYLTKPLTEEAVAQILADNEKNFELKVDITEVIKTRIDSLNNSLTN